MKNFKTLQTQIIKYYKFYRFEREKHSLYLFCMQIITPTRSFYVNTHKLTQNIFKTYLL